MSRTLTIGFVGNVGTDPFGKVAQRLSAFADVTVTHLPSLQVEAALTAADPVDVLVVHLDRRRFFDVAPDDRAVGRAELLAGLVVARLAPSRQFGDAGACERTGNKQFQKNA